MFDMFPRRRNKEKNGSKFQNMQKLKQNVQAQKMKFCRLDLIGREL
jgi:hypothetical protein